MAFTFRQLSIYGSNATDVDFRQWGGAISTAIGECGLVKTADTGQVDWGTATRSTSTNTAYGYEVWRFNDALQATAPVVFKLEYGTGPNDYRNPSMWVTVGTGSNGSGTIVADSGFPNAVHTRQRLSSSANSNWYTTSRSPFWVSSDSAGSLCLAGWMLPPGSSSPTYAGIFFLIERTRDWDGTPNAQGAVTSFRGDVASPVNTQTLIVANAANFAQGNAHSGVLGMTPNSIRPYTGVEPGGVVNVYPVFTGACPAVQGPSKHVVSVMVGDFAAYATLPLTVYAEAGTYVVLGANAIGWDLSGSGVATGAFRVA